jgi:hypothetical protein
LEVSINVKAIPPKQQSQALMNLLKIVAKQPIPTRIPYIGSYYPSTFVKNFSTDAQTSNPFARVPFYVRACAFARPGTS